MKIFSHKKGCNLGMTQVHVEPPPIPLIKSKYDVKPDKDFVKLKFCRDSTSSASDLYDFSISLFDNGEREEFLFFVCNFNTTIATSGMLETGAKVQYLHTLVRGDTVFQSASLSDDVESTDTLTF